MSLASLQWRAGTTAAIATLAVGCLLLVTLWSGLLAPVDQALRQARFEASDRPPSGDTVFVDIDSASLEAVGVWPWPRQLHAEMLDTLMALGSAEVVFDIDFSSASTPEGDMALELALKRAGGYAFLAAFRQLAPDGSVVLNQPIPRFAAQAEPVLVNVDGDGTGLLRSVPAALSAPFIRSVAFTLVPTAAVRAPEINIDFGIDLAAISRISAREVLFGDPDSELFANKQVVIGASAIELRDVFRVPRFGVIPGPLVQLAATETLKADRQLTDWGRLPGIILSVAACGLIALLGMGRTGLPRLAATGFLSMVLVELGAWLAQWHAAIVLDTAIYHLSVVLLVAAALLVERTSRWRTHLQQQARLAYLASHDPGSGARSRHALLEQLAPHLAEGKRVRVYLVHLGRLDQAVASLGHALGERVAQDIVLRLERQLGISPARIGFDLFAWETPAPPESGDAVDRSASIGAVLDVPYAIDGHEVILESRFGIATGGNDMISAAELLRQADVALGHARAHALKAAHFEAEQSALIDQRRLRDIALRQALQNQEFTLLFQPQIELASQLMVGVEALIRWNSPSLGQVSPADFIPLAEETGLIVELGDWVLNEACRQAARWPWPGRLSVNVSSAQFRLGDVVESVTKALAASGFDAHRLDLEITESLFVGDDTTVIAALQQLRGMGIHIALDDFGTGYSSLSYLARLPIDKLKIDQAFVRPLPDPHHEALVETIVLMAKRLGMTVVAEGVETVHQRDYLARLGCEVGQGYLFGRPSPPGYLGLDAVSVDVA